VLDLPKYQPIQEGCLEMAQAKKPEKENEPSGPNSPEFGEQARALNEQILETATKVGEDAVQRYVGWLQTIAEEQRKLASSPQVSEMAWFASMLKVQADFTEQFANMMGSTSFGQQSQS
jgi:phosphoribosylaminoimidazole-succinocarboxamide synthase